MSAAPTDAAGRLQKLRGRIGMAAAGGVLAVASVLIFLRLTNEPPPEALTAERLEAARSRWAANGPLSYEMLVQVTAAETSKFRVRVERGQPVGAELNGRPLESERLWSVWTATGMFDTLGRDLQTQARRASGSETAPQLEVSVDFDPANGLPRRCRRIEWGAGREAAWEVLEFTPRPSPRDGPSPFGGPHGGP